MILIILPLVLIFAILDCTQENFVDRVKATIYDCAMYVMTNNKQFKEVNSNEKNNT